jgi:hypothetical protein
MHAWLPAKACGGAIVAFRICHLAWTREAISQEPLWQRPTSCQPNEPDLEEPFMPYRPYASIRVHLSPTSSRIFAASKAHFSPKIDAKFCHSQTLPLIQVSLHPHDGLACRTYIPSPPLNLTSTLFHPYATQYSILRSHGQVFLAQLAEAYSGPTVI